MASSQNVRKSIWLLLCFKRLVLLCFLSSWIIAFDMLWLPTDANSIHKIVAGPKSKQQQLSRTKLVKRSFTKSSPTRIPNRFDHHPIGPQELIHPTQVLNIKLKPSTETQHSSFSFEPSRLSHSPIFHHNYHRHFSDFAADMPSSLNHNLLIDEQKRYRREALNATSMGESAGKQQRSDIDLEAVRTNITRTLNTLLRGYDRDLRPGFFESKPLQIYVSLNVRNLGPVSEQDMDYVFDCYFRHRWRDERLMFGQTYLERLSFFTLDAGFLKQIWKPNTYFHNVSYPDDQIVYNWVDDDAIEIPYTVQMSQFYLSSFRQGNCTAQLLSGPTHALLLLEWQFKRQMGFFMLQIYLPCTLIVILSWVGFWLNREATSDRVTLGIMSVLTLSSLGIDARKDLPKMSHGTALDWFLIVCYLYVSASLILFCVVHYFTKVNNSGEEPVILQLTRQHQAVKHRRKINQILTHERRANHLRVNVAKQSGGVAVPKYGQWSIGVVASSRSADNLSTYRGRDGISKAVKTSTANQNSVYDTNTDVHENTQMGNNIANDVAPKRARPRVRISNVPRGEKDDGAVTADEAGAELSDSVSTADFHYSRALSADRVRRVHYLDEVNNSISEDDNDDDNSPPPSEYVVGDENFAEVYGNNTGGNFMWRRDVYGRQCRVPSSRGRVLGVASQRHPPRTSAAAISAASLRSSASMRRTSLLEPVHMVQMFPPARRASLLEQGESLIRRCFYCVAGNEEYRYRQATRRKTMESHNSVSLVDHISRVVFPLSFLVFNLIYWTWYKSDDVLSDDANREWQNFMNCTVDETKKYT